MTDAPKYTSLRDYLRVLRERRLLIVVMVLAFTGAALAVSLRQTPVYKASASLSFRPENEDLGDIGAAQPVTETPEQRAAIKSQSIKDLDIALAARKALDNRFTAAEILSKVVAQPEARTHFVVVTVSAATGEDAAALANAFAEAAKDVETERVRERYVDLATLLERQNRGLSRRPANNYARVINTTQINKLRNLSKFAEPVRIARLSGVPAQPVSPKPVRNTILGVLVGLTFAIIVAFMRDALDRRFKTMREIKDDLKLPMVGHVRDEMLGRTFVGSKRSGALSGAELEAFRILRTNVEFLDVDTKGSTVLVTSAMPEEGKSTVSSALAAAYAAAGGRVLLVECDLRRPKLADRLGINRSPGLTDFLAGTAQPRDVLQVVSLDGPVLGTGNGAIPTEGQPSLVCITAGSPAPQPAEMLGSKRFAVFLEQVTGAYDTVILDSSPLLSVVDTLELVPSADRVILCVRASRTTRDQARAAKSALEHLPARPMGIVVTGIRPGGEDEYGYYSYGYAYGPD